MNESVLFLEELYKSLYGYNLKLTNDKKLEKLIEIYKSDIIYFNDKANDISAKHKYEWFNKTPFANLFIYLHIENIIDDLKDEFNRNIENTLDELRDEIKFNINKKFENELKTNEVNKISKWDKFNFYFKSFYCLFNISILELSILIFYFGNYL